MLELAASAGWKEAARRLLMAGARLDHAIVAQRIARNREGDVASAGADPIAPGRDADDWLAQ
jgi:hypothetical protein